MQLYEQKFLTRLPDPLAQSRLYQMIQSRIDNILVNQVPSLILTLPSRPVNALRRFILDRLSQARYAD